MVSCSYYSISRPEEQLGFRRGFTFNTLRHCGVSWPVLCVSKFVILVTKKQQQLPTVRSTNFTNECDENIESLILKFSEGESSVMAGSAKNNLKDKLEDGELDLSMMQYNDVPVKVLLSVL